MDVMLIEMPKVTAKRVSRVGVICKNSKKGSMIVRFVLVKNCSARVTMHPLNTH